METVKDVFTKFRTGLANVYDDNEIEAITALVLSDLLNTNKARLKAFPDDSISKEKQDCLQTVLDELTTGKPLQYIIGHTDFYGLTFEVNPSVLIPRPETEELVQWILETVQNNQEISILDIGTGSGCIPVALKKNLFNANVHAIDISLEAIATAKENANLNNVNVGFIQADILTQPDIGLPRLDLIVSNPPYVTPADKEKMHHNVTNFEPHLALFVPQNDPLLFYDAISTFALKNLKDGGFLFFEINESYGEETMQLLKGKSFNYIELKKDISGRNRMIKAEFRSH